MLQTKNESEKSRNYLSLFKDSSNDFIIDLQTYIDRRRKQSENFSYWMTFIELVIMLENLIRADREGDWDLHLGSVQSMLSMFAVFDNVNYLRWASIYLEDMQRLPDIAPEVYAQFTNENFSIKRTSGKFRAVGGDQALEQTIIRSQKSISGIIGMTQQKEYVAEWEIIYHEMLSVSNLFRNVTGIKTSTYDSENPSHDHNSSRTLKTEEHVQNIMIYILKSENPFGANDNKELHNILTQQVMTPEIRKDLLNFKVIGNEKYIKLRKERFEKKTSRISDTSQLAQNLM